MIDNLMVGDWVYNKFNKQPERVNEIYKSSLMLYYNDIYELDDVELISLNPKILERNGFTLYNPGQSKTAPIYGITFPACNIVLAWIDYYWQLTIDSIVYRQIKIKYVNELQHVLKLLNVKIEVVL